MIRTGHPEGIVTLHPLETDDDILQGVVQSMAQVQCPGHIWGWDNDRKWLTVGIHFTMEQAALFPQCVDSLLRVFVVEAVGNSVSRESS